MMLYFNLHFFLLASSNLLTGHSCFSHDLHDHGLCLVFCLGVHPCIWVLVQSDSSPVVGHTWDDSFVSQFETSPSKGFMVLFGFFLPKSLVFQW